MDRIQKQCNPVQGAAWGQNPTLDLQLGMRYRQFDDPGDRQGRPWQDLDPA